MKNLVFVGLLFLSMVAKAEEKPASEQVKEVLLEIFELCKKENDVLLAKHIVYRGENKERKWKDICNNWEHDEMMRVRIMRLNIQKRLLPYQYEFVNFHQETESEGTWNVWELKYTKDGEEKKMFFAFLKIKGAYALGDIDS